MLEEISNFIILELLYTKAYSLPYTKKQELILKIFIFNLKSNCGTHVLTIIKTSI